MKLLMSLLVSLCFAHVVQAGPKPISKRVLNIVKKNHLWVAKVKHPAPGLKLFDACFDGQNFVSKSNSTASRCVEKEWVVSEDDKYDVMIGEEVLTDAEYQARFNGKFGGLKGLYTPSCVAWEKYNPTGSMNRTKKKAVNCRWVWGYELPFGHYAHGDSEKAHDQFRICDYKTVAAKFPLTQTIEVYQLHDNFSDRVYYHSSHADRAQPGYQRYSYTIPSCSAGNGDLPDKDIPDTKK